MMTEIGRTTSREGSGNVRCFISTTDLSSGDTDPTDRGASPDRRPRPGTALSAKELEDLANLFTIREERCFSRASRAPSQLSHSSLTSSQLAQAAFIYQTVDFEVLARCVPGFVKTHLSKNGRYQPETFILRVNYWRRRRALGEDSTAKRAAKEAARNSGDQAPASPPRAASARSPRPQSSASKQTEARVTMISG